MTIKNSNRIEVILTCLFTGLLVLACRIVENPKLKDDYRPQPAGGLEEECKIEVILFSLEGCRHCKTFAPKWGMICDKYKNDNTILTDHHEVLQDGNHDRFLKPFEEKYDRRIRIFPCLIITKNGERVIDPDFKFESIIEVEKIYEEIEKIKRNDTAPRENDRE